MGSDALLPAKFQPDEKLKVVVAAKPDEANKTAINPTIRLKKSVIDMAPDE